MNAEFFALPNLVVKKDGTLVGGIVAFTVEEFKPEIIQPALNGIVNGTQLTDVFDWRENGWSDRAHNALLAAIQECMSVQAVWISADRKRTHTEQVYFVVYMADDVKDVRDTIPNPPVYSIADPYMTFMSSPSPFSKEIFDRFPEAMDKSQHHLFMTEPEELKAHYDKGKEE